MASTARGITRVLILADAPVLRGGLVSMINETAGMQSVGTPGELRRALTLVETARPDAVVVELGPGKAATLNACRDLRRRFPRVTIVALATSEDPAVVNEAVAAGVRGYLLLNTSPTLLGWAILAARAARTVRLLGGPIHGPGPRAGIGPVLHLPADVPATRGGPRVVGSDGDGSTFRPRPLRLPAGVGRRACRCPVGHGAPPAPPGLHRH